MFGTALWILGPALSKCRKRRSGVFVLAAFRSEVEEIRLTLITFVTNHSRLTTTSTTPVTLKIRRTCVQQPTQQLFDYYIRQVNGVKLADIMFSLLSVCLSVSTQSHWFEWAEWRIVRQKWIRLVREKLIIFPYGQYIVGIYVSLAFWW